MIYIRRIDPANILHAEVNERNGRLSNLWRLWNGTTYDDFSWSQRFLFADLLYQNHLKLQSQYFATNEPISSDGNIEYAVEMYSAPNIQCTQTIDESNPAEKRQLENAPPMDYGVCYSIC